MNPQDVAEKIISLSEEYSRISDEMAGLEMLEAKFFQQESDKYTSDRACSRAFNATESGLRLITLKRKEKSLKQEINALKSFLRVKSDQARNLY